MTIETRFHQYVMGVIILVMYTIMTAVFEVWPQWKDPVYAALPVPIVLVLGAVLTFVVQKKAYTYLANWLLKIMRQWPWLKRKILGAYYIEGTWVGFYYEDDAHLQSGDVYLVVDTITQNLSTVMIQGSGFTTSGDTRATWNSTAAQISENGAELIFIASCTIPRESRKCEAVTHFNLHKSKGKKAPDHFHGTSANIGPNEKMMIVRQKKLGNEPDLTDKKALAAARQYYKDVLASAKP